MGTIKKYLTWKMNSNKRLYIWIGILSTIIIVGVCFLTVSVVHIANGLVTSKDADNSNGPFSDKQSGIDNKEVDIGTPKNNWTDKASQYNLTHSVASRPRVSDTPTNIKAEVINSTCMRMTWHAPSLEKMRGVFRGYHLFFREIDATGAPVEHEKTYRSDKSVRDCELIVNDLKSNTSYAIQMSVWYGSHGNGEMSTKIYAKTPVAISHDSYLYHFHAMLNYCHLRNFGQDSYKKSRVSWKVQSVHSFEKYIPGFKELENVALGKRVIISSVHEGDRKKWGGHFAVDGKLSNTNIDFSHTDKENSPWLKIDLECDYTIQRVVIFNRKSCCGRRLHNVVVKIGPTENAFRTLCGKFKGPGTTGQRVQIDCPAYTRGRFVLVMIEGKPSDTKNMLNLNEVEIFAVV